VHNGAEYGMLEAYSEGFEIPSAGQYDFDLNAIVHLGNQVGLSRGDEAPTTNDNPALRNTFAAHVAKASSSTRQLGEHQCLNVAPSRSIPCVKDYA
jgi:hypothetical protein